MTLQVSGRISIYDVAVELGLSATGLSLEDSRCRKLAGKPYSGTYIALSDFHGKANFSSTNNFSYGSFNVDYAGGMFTSTWNFWFHDFSFSDGSKIASASLSSSNGLYYYDICTPFTGGDQYEAALRNGNAMINEWLGRSYANGRQVIVTSDFHRTSGRGASEPYTLTVTTTSGKSVSVYNPSGRAVWSDLMN